MSNVSPFLLGTQIQYAWDSTSLGWFKECPRKYYYHMVRGLVGRGESVHLEFGQLYHSALELYDKLRSDLVSPPDHEEALREVVLWTLRATWRDGKPWRAGADLPTDDKTSLKNRENLVRTVIWYLDKFKDDPAKLKIDAFGLPMVERNFKFDIGFGFHFGENYLLCGYLDKVVTFQGEDFVMDRKTTVQTLGSYYYDQYDPDNQMSFYTVAAGVAFKNPVKGVIIDAAQIAVGFSRFGRSIAMRTQDQIEEWLADTKMWWTQARQMAEKGHWPMNDKSCHKYGGCPFRPICVKSNVVREKFIETNYEVREWNPLVPR